eukprot:COSAG03_NODE_491_length_7456_cov_22.158353_1_plen_303_part_10
MVQKKYRPSADVAITFTEAASLGLMLTVDQTGAATVKGVIPGTQAAQHPQLKPGLVLLKVGATTVLGMPYKQVIETIKAQGRPLTCLFSSGTAASETAAESPTVSPAVGRAGGPASPTAVADVAVTFTEPGSLGLKFSPNSATRSVDVIGINAGTQAEKHSQLRPGLSLVAVGSTTVTGMPYKQVIETIKAQGRPLTCLFSSGTAASETAAESPTVSPAVGRAGGPASPTAVADVAVTFTEPGSLGLKFSPNSATRSVDVIGINAGTQAEKHSQLRPGLSLVAVGSTTVTGMPYKQVIETIKA